MTKSTITRVATLLALRNKEDFSKITSEQQEYYLELGELKLLLHMKIFGNLQKI